jgi:two-component system phosphate regulon sensor histidine kinase PhoR
MKRAIYARLLLLAVIAVAACSLISSSIAAVDAQKQTKLWLERLTLAAAAIYKQSPEAKNISASSGKLRVTVISPSGQVLSDSESNAANMENHSNRLEIINARQNGVHFETRKSSTLSRRFMYASIKLPDGNVLRLAHEYPGLLSSALLQFPAIASAMAIALVLSLILANRFSSDIARPLEEVVKNLSDGEFDKLGQCASSYYEIDKLLQSMRILLGNISKSNQSLLSEREKVNRILSDMPEGFILLDSQKNMLLCNNSAKKFFGCNRDVQFTNILTLIRDASVNEAIGNALTLGQPAILETRNQAGLTLRVSISPVEAGELVEGEICATVMLMDITSEKKLAEQKQDFFANASHELKTPITSIMGFSEMLSSGALHNEEQKKDVLLRIEKEAKRMSALIDDILQISNLESRTRPLDLSCFDMAGTVREANASISPVAGGKPIQVTLNLEPVAVCANQRQLHDLCANLIENAVKYNVPGGSVSISLKAEGITAVFSISDTGIGIPAKHQSRVFERFFRVDSGREKKIGGTGLGLSIVKHITNLYGGEISLESEEGKGTRIEVRLPVAVANEEDTLSI